MKRTQPTGEVTSSTSQDTSGGVRVDSAPRWLGPDSKTRILLEELAEAKPGPSGSVDEQLSDPTSGPSGAGSAVAAKSTGTELIAEVGRGIGGAAGTGTEYVPDARSGTGTEYVSESRSGTGTEYVPEARGGTGTEYVPEARGGTGTEYVPEARDSTGKQVPELRPSVAGAGSATEALPSAEHEVRPSQGAATSSAVPVVMAGRASLARHQKNATRTKWAEGTRINQYEIIRELGSGGMGTVYRARDDRLGRLVAIKFLQTRDARLTRQFIVEARATAQCSHENIVIIHDVGEYQGSPYMVLEYLEGQTLAAVIKKSAPMAPSRAVELMASAVRALACAHDRGIVHRDLKPENILLTAAGTIKVLDFGIAKVLRGEPQGADGEREGAIMGTMAYMSPEQWGAGGAIDPRTDIWATGIILFEMLAGRHPLSGAGPNGYALVSLLDRPMPSLRDAAPQVPGGLADIVDSCLRKNKSDRMADAATLLRALEPFLPGRGALRPAQLESCPYAGLRSFQEEEAGLFFGRAREVAAMMTRIQDWPLMAAVGPSGVGKSSFVRAGVVPALKASGERWDTLVVRPGRDPVLALAGVLAPLVGTSKNLAEDIGAQRELAKRLTEEPGYLGSVLRGSARRAGGRVLLFVDQFEELYTLCADVAARRAFTACLAAAADDATSPVRVVMSIRSDFLGRVSEDPHFMNELAKGLFFLGAPGTDGLRDALVQPAEMAGYRFETPAMIDEMLQHLESTPGALPLLQFTASQLWEQRDPARKVLTEQSYRALGGIAGALVSHADRVVAELSPEMQALCRSLFVCLVTPDRTRAVRNVDELREIAADKELLQRLIDNLVESRLLVQTGGGGGGATVEIVHESLITTWTRLQRWLDESHEDSVFFEQLWAAARQWQVNRNASGLLWRGEMVDELRRFRRRYRGELPAVARAFSEAVFERAARGARRRRRLVAGAVVILCGLLAAAGVALIVIRNAQKSAETNAVLANQAKQQAQRRLEEVEAKERQRQRAETLRKVAESEAATAKTKVALTAEELAVKNEELTKALDRAEQQRLLAQEAQTLAERNEKAATASGEQARKLAQQLEDALNRERERADRLARQLGSPLVERLW